MQHCIEELSFAGLILISELQARFYRFRRFLFRRSARSAGGHSSLLLLPDIKFIASLLHIPCGGAVGLVVMTQAASSSPLMKCKSESAFATSAYLCTMTAFVRAVNSYRLASPSPEQPEERCPNSDPASRDCVPAIEVRQEPRQRAHFSKVVLWGVPVDY